MSSCIPVAVPIDLVTPYQLLAGLLSASCTQRYGIDSSSLELALSVSEQLPIIPVVTLSTRYDGIQTVTYVQSIYGAGSPITVQLMSAGNALCWQQLGEPESPAPVYTLAWATDGTRVSGTYFQLANFGAGGLASVKSDQTLTLLPAGAPAGDDEPPPALPFPGMRAYILLGTEGTSAGDWVSRQSVLFATPDALSDALESRLIVGRPLAITWTLFSTFPIPTTSRIPDACVQVCI
jgi:hypothetical protein